MIVLTSSLVAMAPMLYAGWIEISFDYLVLIVHQKNITGLVYSLLVMVSIGCKFYVGLP